jgi:hypothetical protein
VRQGIPRAAAPATTAADLEVASAVRFADLMVALDVHLCAGGENAARRSLMGQRMVAPAVWLARWRPLPLSDGTRVGIAYHGAEGRVRLRLVPEGAGAWARQRWESAAPLRGEIEALLTAQLRTPPPDGL